MSEKQAAKHRADYWNGYLSRVEAQKVFDQQAQVINQQSQTLQKMDAVIACMAEKVGLTLPDVEAWIKAKTEAAQVIAEAQPEQQPDKNTEPTLVTLD